MSNGSILIVGPEGYPQKVDKSGRSCSMEFAHKAAHDDVLVTASEYMPDVDIAVPRVYLFKPAAGQEIHVEINLAPSGACLVEIYKDPVITANGTALQTMRHHFGSAKVTAAAVFHTPSLTGNGDKKFSFRTPGASGGNPNTSFGGQLHEGSEIVVTADHPMLMVVTAEANDMKLSLAAEYYEVEA